jgi:hypothetical protein
MIGTLVGLALTLASGQVASEGAAARPGPHRAELLAAIERWPLACLGELRRAAQSAAEPRFIAFETPGHPNAVGLAHAVTIAAPLDQVRKLLDDVDGYQRLFFTFESVRVRSGPNGNRVIEWEQAMPVPLVPNVRYSTLAFRDDAHPGRVFYRYQLEKSDDLKSIDSLIVVERAGAGTLYTEVDFFEPNDGPFADLVRERLWSDAVRDSYYGDLAVKSMVEHPGWTQDQVKARAEAAYSSAFAERVLEKKRPFELPR